MQKKKGGRRRIHIHRSTEFKQETPSIKNMCEIVKHIFPNNLCDKVFTPKFTTYLQFINKSETPGKEGKKQKNWLIYF